MDEKLVKAQIAALGEAHTKLHGQMLAAHAAIRALASLNPDAGSAVRKAVETLIAESLNSRVADDTIAGIALAKERLLPRATRETGDSPR